MKLTLTDLTNLQNETSVVTAINANNAAIENAIENTLSRDGTDPNQMEAPLDMNSEQIVNLPAPATVNSPLRLQDLNAFIGGGTITNIPVGGTTGQVLAKHSNTNYDVNWTNSATSVGLAAPADLTVTNSPVTTTGTLTLAWATPPTGTGAVVRGTSPTLVTPALGTPSAAVLTNATGLPVSTGVSGLAAGVATFLGTPTSANLKTAVTDETGSGSLVFATSPALTTPTGIVKGDVGLGNVDNTSDALKPASTAQATLNASYVVGPASAVTARIPVWSGTSGKLLSDSTYALPAGTIIGTTDSQTLTNKSISGSANTLSNISTNTNLTFGQPPGIASLVGPNTYFIANGSNATEATVQVPLPQAMTLKSFFAYTFVAPGGAQTQTITVRKNGVDTALTCTITGAAVTANDTTHTVAFAAGDLISIKNVFSATAASTGTVSYSLVGVTTSP